MLNLFFKKKLTNEQDERILNELKGFSIRYEHDVFGIDTKISVYSIREQDSLKIIDKLKSLNFVFGHQIFHGNPMFHDEFVRMDEEEEILSHEEAERAQEAREMTKRENLSPPPLPSAANSQIVEHKPIVQRTNAGADSDHDSTRFPYSPPPPIPDVVSNQLEEIQKGQRELRQIVNDLITARNAVSAPPTPASTSSVAPKSRAPYVVDCPAKNELIANGIRCEMCKETVKEMDIGKMVCALREHVICHFNRECPQLKRFECAVCKTLFTTNFVDEFEMHLKKHGTPLPEVRKKCMKNLTTKTHLQIIANLCLKCFPDVFEKEPPRLDTIKQVDTPANAKKSVFPMLDNLFCMKFKVPNACRGRRSLPPVIVSLS